MKAAEKQMSWYSSVLMGFGMLLGIILVSVIKHHGLDWLSIGRASGAAVLFFVGYYLFCRMTGRRSDEI